MTQVTNDVHQQFAEYFPSKALQPYLYLLSKKLGEGHICLDINGIDKEELAGAGYNDQLNNAGLLNEPLVSAGDAVKPFILYNHRLYLHRYFHYETIILNSINELIKQEQSEQGQRLSVLSENKDLIKEVFKGRVAKKGTVNWSLAAAITAVLNNFTIITGGPGTGKTFSVAKILSILFSVHPGLKVALAAPTGKAAARMAESLKKAAAGETELLRKNFESLQPSTIHRLLGPLKNSPHFKHNSGNPLHYDVVIVDESSMIDVALFAKLLDATGPGTRLILLGDKDQLASVEAGSLFGDLCLAQEKLNVVNNERAALINTFIDEPDQQITSEYIDDGPAHPLFQHIIELHTSHRFSDDEGIGKFSKAIIHNREPDIKAVFNNTDPQVLIDPDYEEKIFEAFIMGYSAFINEKDIAKAIILINNLRVLCAVREGEKGLYATNKKIEKYLQQKKLLRITGDFYEHRPVMVTSNNYELQLFNGDIGIIRPDEKGVLKAWFEAANGEVKAVLPGYLSNVETVYAMTIHKSQGSEFDEVLVMLPKGQEIAILTRELLYTAVTRAKKKVIVQGSEAMILQTARAKVERGSGIIERFNGAACSIKN